MCCVLSALVLIGPRAAVIFWWLLQPARWAATFDTILWPLLGFLLLPWVTLVYVAVAPGGIVGLDLLWLGLAFAIDVGSYGGGYYGRKRGPG